MYHLIQVGIKSVYLQSQKYTSFFVPRLAVCISALSVVTPPPGANKHLEAHSDSTDMIINIPSLLRPMASLLLCTSLISSHLLSTPFHAPPTPLTSTCLLQITIIISIASRPEACYPNRLGEAEEMRLKTKPRFLSPHGGKKGSTLIK